MKLGHVALVSMLTTTALAGASAELERVALLLPNCEPAGLSASDVRDALTLDLRDSSLLLAPPGELTPSTDALVRIESACDGSSSLALHAEYQGERHSRNVDLGELPPAQRARALSLSLTELLSLFSAPRAPTAATSEEPEPAEPMPGPKDSAAEPAPPTPPQAPPPKPGAKAIAPTPAPHAPPASAPAKAAWPSDWQLALGPEVRFFSPPLLGARTAVRYRSFSAGGALLRGSTTVLAGTVVVVTPHVFAGYALTAWQTQGHRIEVEPRFGAGRTFMHAAASPLARGTNAQDVYLDFATALRYSRRLAEHWSCGVSAELGYAAGPIAYADTQEIARTSGIFGSLTVEATLWR